MVCRRGRRWAGLWDRAELVAKRAPSPAQLEAVSCALAARRWCPACRRDVGYCIPVSLGVCGACDPPLDAPQLPVAEVRQVAVAAVAVAAVTVEGVAS